MGRPRGGGSGAGCVYELAPGGYAESVIYGFGGGNDGANPSAGLIRGTMGELYGTTTFGGASSSGTVFVLRHARTGFRESVLRAFSKKDGAYPLAGLAFGTDRAVYGTTSYGGFWTSGTAFRQPI